MSTVSNGTPRCTTSKPNMSLTCSSLLKPSLSGSKIRIADHPKLLGFRVDVDARDHADAQDYALLVATPLLLAAHLNLRSEALVEHGIIEDQARLRVRLQERLELLEEQEAGSQLLGLQEVAVDGGVAPTLEVLGQVGQGVVDLAAQQILAVVQLREAHAFRVADSLSA
jgi:hypothetical protein